MWYLSQPISALETAHTAKYKGLQQIRPLNIFKCFLPKSGSALGMEQNEVPAAVFRPGRFVVGGIRRLVFAVTDGADAHGVNPGLGQCLAQRQRAAFTERTVVFLRAALVAISLDEQL